MLYENNYLRSEVPYQYMRKEEFELEDRDVLLKTQFTLVGTDKCNTVPVVNHYDELLPMHKCYYSIAMIEAVGNSVGEYQKGEMVLLNSTMAKYSKHNIDNNRLYRIKGDMNSVNMTFLPLVCSALSLCNELEYDDGERVILLGSGLFGAILAKLLVKREKEVIILTKKEDIKKSVLERIGAKVQLIEEGCIGDIKEDDIVICIDQDVYEKVNSALNLYSFDDLKNEYQYADLRGEAMSILNEEIEINDLIAQHVHSEFIDNTLKMLSENVFFGKAIIYDW